MSDNVSPDLTVLLYLARMHAQRTVTATDIETEFGFTAQQAADELEILVDLGLAVRRYEITTAGLGRLN